MLRPNIVALIATKLSCTGIPIVISEHTTISYSLTQVSKISAALLKLLIRKLYRCAESIIAVSAGVASDTAQILGADSKTVHVIHNPVVSNDLISLSFERSTHPWLLNKSSQVILSVGRLTKAKDYATLIKSFNIIRTERDARLIILGEGELRSELQALIAECGLSDFVSMPGYVDNPYSYMRQSDLFVLSSQWEGFGNVLVEAMMCNVPIVSTNCASGPAEILEDGKWGTLVPVGDSQLLAHAVVQSLTGARTHFENRANQFTIDKVASDYLGVLLRTISEKKPHF
jgi:glycosyltransferase involved in cell wall biosynthesis